MKKTMTISILVLAFAASAGVKTMTKNEATLWLSNSVNMSTVQSETFTEGGVELTRFYVVGVSRRGLLLFVR